MDNSDPVQLIMLKQPADEFWPDYVANGIVVHAHPPSRECNIKCCVVASLAGLTDPIEIT